MEDAGWESGWIIRTSGEEEERGRVEEGENKENGEQSERTRATSSPQRLSAY